MNGFHVQAAYIMGLQASTAAADQAVHRLVLVLQVGPLMVGS